jgi:hypothetical protein
VFEFDLSVPEPDELEMEYEPVYVRRLALRALRFCAAYDFVVCVCLHLQRCSRIELKGGVYKPHLKERYR